MSTQITSHNSAPNPAWKRRDKRGSVIAKMGKHVYQTRCNRGQDDGSMKVLEFYAGIGGMHCALDKAKAAGKISAYQVLSGFDINPAANDVYAHNFGASLVRCNNIERIPKSQLDDYGAYMWMLAPPCQPYTRQGLKKDAGDARAKSFMALLAQIASMKQPPQKLIVENVVGFETSITREALKGLLQKNGYHFQEFILSPKDFGTPYSRPRYFCVAQKAPFPVTKAFDEPWTCTPQVLLEHLSRGQDRWEASPQEAVPVRDLSTYMEASPTDVVLATSSAHGPAAAPPGASASTIPPITRLDPPSNDDQPTAQPKLPRHGSLPPDDPAAVLRSSPGGTSAAPCHKAPSPCSPPAPDPSAGPPAEGPRREAGGARCEDKSPDREARRCSWQDFAVPDAVIQKSAHCIDIVTAELHDANCFTKSYSKYTKGTGSVVATENLHLLGTFPDWAHREPACAPQYASTDSGARPAGGPGGAPAPEGSGIQATMQRLGLRYFTPREVANLHAFPESFAFPEHVTLKQRYACLGNSLSVEVVAALLEYLFHDDDTFGPPR